MLDGRLGRALGRGRVRPLSHIAGAHARTRFGARTVFVAVVVTVVVEGARMQRLARHG
jgi:hypothetical protein